MSKPRQGKAKRHLQPMQYMWELYDATAPSMTFAASSEEEWRAWRRRLKAKFRKLMGGLDQPRCELRPSVSRREQMDGYTREHVVFQSRPNLTVAAWVLVPDGCTGPTPTMVCLQGHGPGKDDIIGIDDEGKQRREYGGYQKDFAVQAAHRGFVVIAPDMFSFGECRDPVDAAKGRGASSCQRPSMAGILMGQTVPGIRVYDVTRCIDYLETRPECDRKRIGCMGISGGGTITTFAAAVEERIHAALISGYLSHWRHSIMPLHHCEDNYVPGVLQFAEMPDIATLIAPRPVFFENGTEDNIFPIKSARSAYRKIKAAYRMLGLADHCGMQIFNGPHQFCGEKGFPFLEKWLMK